MLVGFKFEQRLFTKHVGKARAVAQVRTHYAQAQPGLPCVAKARAQNRTHSHSNAQQLHHTHAAHGTHLV